MTARHVSVAACLALAFALGGCIHVHDNDRGGYRGHHGRGHGPPPHAPAHGYRTKHHDRDLQYDSGLGVYVVVGLPDIFFHDDHYYRWLPDRWELGAGPTGPWRVVTFDHLPGRLRVHKAKHHGKGKGHEKDKH